eukprot:TRINITY_DN9129_c0_g1_i1.p1 TRINITY_DN9129_c0_g1~~TRINITY_DN9129_c0_g1_i1.p1  ORF type:complete len:104 (-),score=25.75 TRINITY_DN9129_c0_g1_i1:57-368(-)
MAARRPVLCAIVLAAACIWMLRAPAASEDQVFLVPTRALRTASQGNFAGAELRADSPLVVMQALPEPRPNDAMLPVELNRSSLYWGLLLFCVLSVLFSSYFFN